MYSEAFTQAFEGTLGHEGNAMSESDWHWIAGFFEGEGSAGCYSSDKGRYKLHASISQKEKQTLDAIQALVGYGSVTQCKGSWGKVYHWRVCNAQARKFLNDLLPYLRTGKKWCQVQEALQTDKEKTCPRNTRPNLKLLLNTPSVSRGAM